MHPRVAYKPPTDQSEEPENSRGRQAARRGQTPRLCLPGVGGQRPTFHRWRAQYGGMKADDAKRLKDLERENARMKKLLAEAELDK